MEIFKALWKFIVRKDKKIAESMTDKIEDNREAIKKAEQSIERINNAIAEYMAERKVISNKIPVLKREIEKFNGFAEMCLTKNDEDGAGEALEKVALLEAELQTVELSYTNMGKDIEDERKELEKFKKIVDEAKSNHERAKIQHNMNNARNMFHKNAGGFSAKSISEKMNQLTEEVTREDARLDAQRELETDGSEKFEEMAAEQNKQQRLDALKAKMAEKKVK